MAKTFQQKLFRLHSWLGLFNGVWLLLLGISGALLVYYQEIDRWVNKDILTVKPKEHRLPVDSLYKIVRAKHPAASGANIMWFPKSETDCYSFRLYDMAEKKDIYYSWDLYQVDINPYTGEIVREGYYRDFFSFLHWLLTFHYCLQMGTPGMLIVTIAGILLFINIITGIIIYRKYFFRALVFRAPVQWKNWRTGSSGIHRYIGVWSLVFDIMIFYSGLQMNWTVFDKTTWTAPKPQPKNNQPYANIDSMMQKVQEIYPGFAVKYFYIPFNRSFDGYINEEHISASGDVPGTPKIFPEGSSSIKFDANSGAVLEKKNINEEVKKMNLWEKFNAISFSFHVGSFAGNFSRVLYLFIGLTPALLSFSGFLLWRRRKIKRRSSSVETMK